jgi:chemotaxis protein MotA
VDIATLLGLLGGISIVVASMAMGGNGGVFVNVPSLLIVFGGSIFIVLSKFGLGQFFAALKTAAKAFFFKKFSAPECIEEAVKIADAARKGGLLSLEGVQIENDFMKKGVQLLIDGHEPDVIKAMLYKDMNLTFERHIWGQKVFRALGDVAPAMGMIGTLVGLVLMLSTMDDPKTIGPSMAVALLTTLYGAMIANMFAMPIADKLELRSSEEKTAKALVIDALLGIQAGQNPRVIEEALKNYLPSNKRGAE